MKRKNRQPEFTLPEIRRALRKWVGIWIDAEYFKVNWHNFKHDLLDIKARKRPIRTHGMKGTNNGD